MMDVVLGSDEDSVDVIKNVEKSGPSSKRDSVPVEISGSSEIAQADLTKNEQKRHFKVVRYINGLKQKSKKKMNTTESDYVTPIKGVNLRDVGAVTRGPMKEDCVYRSSELLSKEEMKVHKIKTILDLRRMDRPCKAEKSNAKAAESIKTILKYLVWGPSKIIPEKRLLYIHRAHPEPCPLCHERAKRRYESDITVIHADLIPSTVGLQLFCSMPMSIKLKSLGSACVGHGAGSIMAPAVANNKLLGYKAMYRTLLEDSKRGMAMAIRPFVDEKNYPILVHCIHGKDRTGLIMMLLLMLCGVDKEAIVDDYVLSETVLKESRMHQELKLDVYLTSDEVIAASRDTMDDTIEFIKEKYADAEGYFSEIGLENDEIEKIKENLIKKEALPSLQRNSSFKPKFSIASIFKDIPFARRFSTPDGAKSKSKLERMTTIASSSSSGGQELSPGEKSTSLETSFRTTRTEAPSFRRASLAGTAPVEIRSLLRKLREDHPELAPVTEDEAHDFLRHSPDAKMAALKTHFSSSEDNRPPSGSTLQTHSSAPPGMFVNSSDPANMNRKLIHPQPAISEEDLSLDKKDAENPSLNKVEGSSGSVLTSPHVDGLYEDVEKRHPSPFS